MSIEEILLLPDYMFIQHCHQHYRIDRSSYSLINESLYQYGLDETVERRRHVLYFLQYYKMKKSSNTDPNDIKIVKLEGEIQEYLEESFILLHMRELAIS